MNSDTGSADQNDHAPVFDGDYGGPLLDLAHINF
jgi:hypothetical protein